MWLSTNLQVCLHSHTFNYFLCEMFLAPTVVLTVVRFAFLKNFNFVISQIIILLQL